MNDVEFHVVGWARHVVDVTRTRVNLNAMPGGCDSPGVAEHLVSGNNVPVPNKLYMIRGTRLSRCLEV